MKLVNRIKKLFPQLDMSQLDKGFQREVQKNSIVANGSPMAWYDFKLRKNSISMKYPTTQTKWGYYLDSIHLIQQKEITLYDLLKGGEE